MNALYTFLSFTMALLLTTLFCALGFWGYQKGIYTFWEYTLSEAINMVQTADQKLEKGLGASHPESKDLALKVCTGSLVFESSRSAMKALTKPVFNFMLRILTFLCLTPLICFFFFSYVNTETPSTGNNNDSSLFFSEFSSSFTKKP